MPEISKIWKIPQKLCKKSKIAKFCQNFAKKNAKKHKISQKIAKIQNFTKTKCKNPKVSQNKITKLFKISQNKVQNFAKVFQKFQKIQKIAKMQKS